MAKAVEFRTFKPANSREDLIRRIEAAPETHADAVLEAYDLLENLHQKGILSALNGALGASGTIIDKVVDVISSKDAVTATRVGLMFGNLLSSVDANQISKILAASGDEPPSLFAIAKLANAAAVRRGMAIGISLLGILGAAAAAHRQAHETPHS
jgi:uncharacterized protein YjgD (DUF1641 family)